MGAQKTDDHPAFLLKRKLKLSRKIFSLFSQSPPIEVNMIKSYVFFCGLFTIVAMALLLLSILQPIK